MKEKIKDGMYWLKKQFPEVFSTLAALMLCAIMVSVVCMVMPSIEDSALLMAVLAGRFGMDRIKKLIKKLLFKGEK